MDQTWKLTMTPPEGPRTVATGLSREQTMAALTDLMYGTWDEPADAATVADRAGERVEALAA